MSLTITNPLPTTTQPANTHISFGIELASSQTVKLYTKRERENNVAFRFLIFSDSHWGQTTYRGTLYESGGYYHGVTSPYQLQHSEFRERLQQLNAAFPIDFVVGLGDIINDDETMLDDLKADFVDILGVPFYPAFGNHDWATDAEWEAVWEIGKNHAFTHKEYGFVIVETGQPRSMSFVAGDAGWVQTQINNLSNTKGIFILQHISPLPKDIDIYSAPHDAMRTQYAREEVLMSFHGHHHYLNNIFQIENNPYIYVNRLGGNGPALDDPTWTEDIELGFSVVSVFHDGTVEVKQVRTIGDKGILRADGFYADQDGFSLAREVTLPAGSHTVTHAMNSLRASTDYFWYVEVGEENSDTQQFSTGEFGEGIVLQKEGVLLV